MVQIIATHQHSKFTEIYGHLAQWIRKSPSRFNESPSCEKENTVESYTTNEKHLKTPDNFTLVENNVDLPKTANRLSDLLHWAKEKGIKATALASIAGASVMVLAGCGGNADAESSSPEPTHANAQVHHHTPEATATPTPSATETAPAAPNYESALTPAEVEQYDQMTPAQFNGLPKETQLAYVLAKTNGTQGIQEFADDFYRVTQDPGDKLTIQPDSKDASQDVVTAELNYDNRISFMFDGDTRSKVTLAFLQGGMSDPRWPSYNKADTDDPSDMTGGAVAVDKIAPGNVITSMSATTLNGRGETVREVVSMNQDGTTNNSEIMYVEIPVAGGGTLGWWI